MAPRPSLSAPSPPSDARSDLGFGSALAAGGARRLLNRDGTFTARRVGLGVFDSIAAYHYLLTISWARFIGWVVVAYLIVNGVFALLYFGLGPDAFAGITDPRPGPFFGQVFFFSVHTIATIGYGNVSPASLSANLVVTLESLAGLVAVALVAGIVFARVSRPLAGIVFSEVAVVAPYGDGRGLMFRLANARRTELIQVQASVSVSLRRGSGPRTFHQLSLERQDVVFLPTSWTVVHPIDEQSPLYGMTREELAASGPELIVLLTATEEDFSQTVHARTSYAADEIHFGARFGNIIRRNAAGIVESVDIGRISEIEPATLPPEARISAAGARP